MAKAPKDKVSYTCPECGKKDRVPKRYSNAPRCPKCRKAVNESDRPRKREEEERLKKEEEEWLKPFQNMRSTRETELMETYPAHVVVAWIGNSEVVARKHYLQVTDEHFQRATDQKVAHQVAHKTREMERIGQRNKNEPRKKPNRFRGISSDYVSVRSLKAPRKELSS